MKTSKKLFLLTPAILAAAALVFLLDELVFASKTIAYGCFHQVAHKGAGCAALIEKRNGQTVLQLMDFKTTENRDLHILLISATDALENETVKAAEQLYVAPLLSADGSGQYVVPKGQDLAKFNAVVIWNNKHGVNFTTAPLKRF